MLAHSTPQRDRRLAIVVGPATTAVLGAALTAWLIRLALTVAGSLDRAAAAEILTALSAAGCAAVAARLSLTLVVVAATSALSGPAHRRGRRLALALSPNWTRPAVALLLATGVTAGGSCSAPPPSAQTVATTARASGAQEPATGYEPHARATPHDGTEAARGDVPNPISGELSSRTLADLPEPTWADMPEATWAELPNPAWAVMPDPTWAGLPGSGWAREPPTAAARTVGPRLLASGGQHAAGSRRATRTTNDPVVVHRGDTLWGIAARHLGRGADDAEVAAEWPRWWRANRDVIGPDPDLLLPGTRLTPPPPPGAVGAR
jgi:resuscitation-promoting factor RpfA